MSDDAKLRGGSKETFWAIPKGTRITEPQPCITLTPAEYERRVKKEKLNVPENKCRGKGA